MFTDSFIGNITNPIILFFVLGIIATRLKSSLTIPEQISKFLSLYLLFSIGFRGGVELAHQSFNLELFYFIILGLVLSFTIPIIAFKILKTKLNIFDSGAISASFGSVSAITFVTAVNFLETNKIPFSGYMVAVMALMEAPAIIMGVLLIRKYADKLNKLNIKPILHEALTNGSVIMILGSLIIGFLSDAKQAESIKPFSSDIFKGFLALFLLDMGIVASKGLSQFKKSSLFLIGFGILFPITLSISTVLICKLIGLSLGNTILMAILAGSASYIAVPAAMRMAVPEADPGIYIPLALAITFPFNILFGIPLYTYLTTHF